MNRNRSLPTLALFALTLLAACGGSSARSPGATLEGTVLGAGSANLTVSVASAPRSTTTDAAGHFVLLDVPAGASELRFHGASTDATLQIEALSKREHRKITVEVSGHDAREHREEAEAELHGTIDALSAPSFTMGGRAVTTTAATAFQKGGAPIAFADLHVGDSVEAEGALQADGSLLARSVKVEDAHAEADGGSDSGSDSSGGEAEDVTFQGSIAAVSATSLTVGTTTVEIAATTRIEKNDQAIAATSLAVGDAVKVEGALQADGSVLAKEIDVLTPAQQASVQVAGAATAVSLADRTFAIGSTTLKVDDHTTFSGEGTFASLADLAVGDLLDVQAQRLPDGSLLALSVQRLEQAEVEGAEVDVKGSIDALTAASLTVQGKTYAVDANTRIDQSGNAIAFSSLKVGQSVEVRGVAQADGSLLATRISLESGN